MDSTLVKLIVVGTDGSGSFGGAVRNKASSWNVDGHSMSSVVLLWKGSSPSEPYPLANEFSLQHFMVCIWYGCQAGNIVAGDGINGVSALSSVVLSYTASTAMFYYVLEESVE